MGWEREGAAHHLHWLCRRWIDHSFLHLFNDFHTSYLPLSILVVICYLVLSALLAEVHFLIMCILTTRPRNKKQKPTQQRDEKIFAANPKILRREIYCDVRGVFVFSPICFIHATGNNEIYERMEAKSLEKKNTIIEKPFFIGHAIEPLTAKRSARSHEIEHLVCIRWKKRR